MALPRRRSAGTRYTGRRRISSIRNVMRRRPHGRFTRGSRTRMSRR